jgi:hypothetical protein
MIRELQKDTIAEIGIERVRISGPDKVSIIKELDRVAINESTMFPEIEKAAQYIKAGLS